MNPVVWAAMQTPEVLGAVDLMIPDLIDEDEFDMLDTIRVIRHQNPQERSFVQRAIENGGVLTAIGLAILAIPDPLVYLVGSHIGGPIGGTIAVVVVNIVGFGLILIDLVF